MNPESKVLLVLNNCAFGGIQQQALNLARYLKAREIEVLVWVATAKKDRQMEQHFSEAGIPVAYYPFLSQIKRRLYYPTTLPYLWRAVQMLKRNNIKVILPYSFHTSMLFGFIHRWGRARASYFQLRNCRAHFKWYDLFFDRQALRQISGIIANSEHAAAAAPSFYRHPRDKVRVIRNGFHPRGVKSERRVWRKRLEIPEDGLLFCHVANNTPIKDYETLIRAWSVFSREHAVSRPCYLVIAGRDSKNGTPISLTKEGRRLAECGLLYIGSTDDSMGLMAAADIGLLSTKNEGCPNVILEYIYQRLPIVATDIDAVREIIPASLHHLLFPQGDSQALRQKLEFAAEHIEHLRKEVPAVYGDLLGERYGEDHNYFQYYQLIREHLG